MVKIISGIVIAFLFLVGFSVFEAYFVNQSFNDFSQRLEILYDKTQNQTATKTDAEITTEFWTKQKKFLHVWIPHNDVTQIDYFLGESMGLIDTQQYDLALGKIQILLNACENIPKSYSFSFENIF